MYFTEKTLVLFTDYHGYQSYCFIITLYKDPQNIGLIDLLS